MRRNKAADFLRIFFQSVLAKKHGDDFKPDSNMFPLKITVVNKSNNIILASSEYLIKYREKTKIILPSKNRNYSDQKVTIKVQLDSDKWMFLAVIGIDFIFHA